MVDRRLHEDRLEASGRMRRWRADAAELPDGAMIDRDGTPFLLRDGRLLEWTAAGYGPPGAEARGEVLVLTPRAIVGAIAAGYAPGY